MPSVELRVQVRTVLVLAYAANGRRPMDKRENKNVIQMVRNPAFFDTTIDNL